jgi:exodeoxyribonuclease VIII
MDGSSQNMNTKIIENLVAEEYHARPEWSVSQLKKLIENPERFRYEQLNPPESTQSQSLGTMVHTAVLEPDEYASRYVIKPDDLSRRGAANKLTYDRFFYEAKQAGKMVVDGDDYQTALDCAVKLRSHSAAAELLLGDGPTEVSIVSEINGLPVRGRPDKYHAPSGYLVDLKTTSRGNAAPDKWPREIVRWRYDMQASMYLSLWTRATGVTPRGFKHVVIETDPPYSIAIYTLGSTWLEIGRKLLLDAIELAKHCTETDTWPAYPEVDVLEAPTWELKRVLDVPIN